MSGTGAVINSISLAIGVVGAGLIWKFGLPADIDRQGHVHIVTEDTNQKEKAQARRYDRRSGIGFLLLIIGFFVQAVGNFL